MDLVDMAVQAIDGTKLQASAAKDCTYYTKGLQQLLERTDTIIEEMGKQNEAVDNFAPLHLPEKLRHIQLLRTEVKAAMGKLETEDGAKRVNLTDSDANLMKSRQVIIVGYNIQTVVSPLKVAGADKIGGMFITAIDTVLDVEYHHQLINMLEQSEEMTGAKADITLADAGYHSGANLAACDERNQMIAIPES